MVFILIWFLRFLDLTIMSFFASLLPNCLKVHVSPALHQGKEKPKQLLVINGVKVMTKKSNTCRNFGRNGGLMRRNQGNCFLMSHAAVGLKKINTLFSSGRFWWRLEGWRPVKKHLFYYYVLISYWLGDDDDELNDGFKLMIDLSTSEMGLFQTHKVNQTRHDYHSFKALNWPKAIDPRRLLPVEWKPGTRWSSCFEAPSQHCKLFWQEDEEFGSPAQGPGGLQPKAVKHRWGCSAAQAESWEN